MPAKNPLRVMEDLLVAELDLLERYNRTLENGPVPDLAQLLGGFRDEEVRRIERLQDRIRTCRIQEEVGA